MNERTIRAVMEGYTEAALERFRLGERVEFEERRVGRRMYLTAIISPRPDPPEEPKPSAP